MANNRAVAELPSMDSVVESLYEEVQVDALQHAGTRNRRATEHDYAEILSLHGAEKNKNTLSSTSSSNLFDAEEDLVARDSQSGISEVREERDMIWTDVSMTLLSTRKQKKKGEPPKKILDGVWGEVPTQKVTAIMGPSGSGKTSLLNVLSGRIRSNNLLTVKTEVRLRNQKVNPTDIRYRKSIAFVAQDDSIQVTATPREAIRFSAKLRLPRTTTKEEIDRVVEEMLDELGLQECADTMVGGELIKGISGGERKRTSVAVELVTKPKLVFLDEPTSGLDSFSAIQLCLVLKKVAECGSSVLFTIHQPSSAIFNTFDHLILLNHGRVMYAGSVDDVATSFANRGYPLPDKYNPADWIMEVALTTNTQQLDQSGFFPLDHRALGDAVPPPKRRSSSFYEVTKNYTQNQNRQDDTPGFFLQTRLLYIREFINFVRAKHAIVARTAMSTMISLLIGFIFFDVANSDFNVFINVQSTFGSLLMALMANVFSTALPSMVSFPEERPVFLREYSTNHYSVTAYFFARMTMEFFVTAFQVLISSLITYNCVGFHGSYGILYADLYLLSMTSTALGVLVGSAVDNPQVAIEFLPAVFMPQILFAGFFVPPHLIPDWMAWIRYICPLTYAVRIALVNEFDGRCDGLPASPANPMGLNYCDSVLENTEANPDEVWWYWLLLALLFVFVRLLALNILRRKASTFY